MNKIRKALLAFATTAASVVVTKLVADGMPADATGWFGLAGAAVGAGMAAGWAVWRVKNAPAVTPPAADPIRRSY